MEENGIHGISARFKGAGIDARSGYEGVNSGGFGLFHADTLDRLVFGFVGVNLGLVLVVVELLGHVLIDIEHHDVQDTIGVVVGRVPASFVGNEYEPMVAGDGAESVPVPIQPLAQATVAVEVIHLLMERSVRKHLISRKVEVLAIVSQPVDFQTDATSQFNKSGNATQEGGGSTSLEHDHVGVHEERTLGKDVGVEVAVGHLRENGAPRTLADTIEVRAGKGSQPDTTDALHLIVAGGPVAEGSFVVGNGGDSLVAGDFAKTHFERLLGPFENSVVLADFSRVVVLVVGLLGLVLDEALLRGDGDDSAFARLGVRMDGAAFGNFTHGGRG
mmetsp:Transcript_25060/g.52702  ORF Transcript_25060/g.52702 Transcript_25060/m.52702 type:complete len:331 (+) Transcript_25060:845-1837(+)